ncbi:MAG: hypothetical protein LBI28_00495 [Treponema sp.]|nr:hypothetical protein [Treponema sp.]
MPLHCNIEWRFTTFHPQAECRGGLDRPVNRYDKQHFNAANVLIKCRHCMLSYGGLRRSAHRRNVGAVLDRPVNRYDRRRFNVVYRVDKRRCFAMAFINFLVYLTDNSKNAPY